MNELLDDPDFAKTRLRALLCRGPLGFVDIGARGGVHPFVEPLAGATAVLGFEPDRPEARRLQSVLRRGPWARAELEPAALGGVEGPAILYRLSANTNDSLRPPNEALTRRYRMVKWREIGRTPLRTTTLDSVLFGRRAKQPHWGEFLKLDTQGTEHEILEGARRTLKERTVAVVCEVEFCALYAGQRLFSDVELLLRNQGFSFYGFTAFAFRGRKFLDKTRERGRERALHADAVFFKDPLPGGGAPDLSPRGRAIVFVCAALMGFHDYAVELARDLWSGPEARRLEAAVRRRAAVPPANSAAELAEAAGRASRDPERAHFALAGLVDRYRLQFSYDELVL